MIDEVMKMKKLYFYSVLLTISMAFLWAGCSEIKENIPVATSSNVHGEGIVKRGAPDHHSVLIKNQKYDMKPCTACHATDYKGGIIGANASCVGCHSQPKGPEACNTCHGSYRNPTIIAPTANGAHNVHLYASVLGKKVNCVECHTVPATYYAAGHIDNPDDPAEIVFGGTLAKKATNGGLIVPVPTYSTANGCANTYCHGTFKNGNLTNTVKWTDKINCGSCHGDPATGNPLPKLPHIQGAFANNCATCHNTVKYDAATVSWTVDSLHLHIDGKLRSFGTDKDF